MEAVNLIVGYAWRGGRGARRRGLVLEAASEGLFCRDGCGRRREIRRTSRRGVDKEVVTSVAGPGRGECEGRERREGCGQERGPEQEVGLECGVDGREGGGRAGVGVDVV